MRTRPGTFQIMREWIESFISDTSGKSEDKSEEPLPITQDQIMHELEQSNIYQEMVNKFMSLPDPHFLEINDNEIIIKGGEDVYEVDLNYILGNNGSVDRIWVVLTNLEKMYKVCYHKYM